MGKVISNQPFGLSGRVDGFVYRQTREGVVVARQPRPKAYAKDRRKPTKAQAAQQMRFREANGYAQRVLADPLARRAYERLGEEQNRRYDRLIVSDFFTPPVIEHVELGGYHGRPGDLIRILAFDDVEVVSVKVEINTASGTPVEQGFAAKQQGVWNYSATVAPAPNETLVITVTARDRPDHATTAKFVYP